MAPAMFLGFATPASSGGCGGVKKSRSVVAGAAAEEEEEAALLRRRNAELEEEVAALRAELVAAWRRAEMAEEAEERLCAQLGEAEVDALELARAYQARVDELSRQLAAAAGATIIL